MSEQLVFITPKRQRTDKALEDGDPYELTGVPYAVAAGDDPDRTTAQALIEEFALQGWKAGAICALFADPRSGHAHGIARRLGDEMLDDLIDGVFGPGNAEVAP